MLPRSRIVLLVLGCSCAGALSASDASPTQSLGESAAAAGAAQTQVGEHRHGQRVEMELAPPTVREAFKAHGGELLTFLVKRTDASGQPVYCALVHDIDQSLVVLSVSQDGHILDKQPPRRHALWRSGDEDQWSGESDSGLWSLADSQGRGAPNDDPLLQRRTQRDQLGGAAPVGSLSSDR